METTETGDNRDRWALETGETLETVETTEVGEITERGET